MTEPIVLQVNGEEKKVETDGDRTLLEVLRDDLGLTGTKYGCGEGQCGACTVLVDDDGQRSCLMKIVAASGRRVRTIEGLGGADKLHPLQQALLDRGALQCGYCTPGMIVAASALLHRNANPDAAAIRKALQGNLCRCGCYPRIVAAVQQAAAAMRNGGGK